jgi:hypothetical protein
MTQISQTFDSSSPGEASMQMNYLTTAGSRIEICRLQKDGQWQPPLVSIYEPALMNAVRLAANPDYHSNDN